MGGGKDCWDVDAEPGAQAAVVKRGVHALGAYIHIPFCARKCGYCDFNAYSGYGVATKEKYVDALCREIVARAEPNLHLDTVFFGGGTPTQLPAGDLVRILDTVRSSFVLAPDAEITVEANPSDVDGAYLSTLKGAGVDRVSFGVQSFDDRTLKLIDRTHDAMDVRRAVDAARSADLRTWSMDLIFGLPRQTVRDWQTTLETALSLDPPHVSVYGLAIEERTPFHARIERGRMTVPGETAQLSMFHYALDRLPDAGLQRYEISNHAKIGHESRHNRMYWRNGDHFGFGAGAAGYRRGERTVNVRRPSEYIRRVAMSPAEPFEDRETLEPGARLGETMMVGLRLAEGIDVAAMSERFGVDVAIRYADAMAWASQLGWAEWEGQRFRLTREGLPLANEVMARFV